MENEPRQHLSLSNYAFQIINEDIALFYETSFSGIINRILKNYDNTKASLSYVAKEAANQFDLIFDDINTNPEMLPKKQGALDAEKAEVSVGFSTTMEMAVEIAKNSGNEVVKMSHVLWAIYEQQESFAVYFIEKQVKYNAEDFLL